MCLFREAYSFNWFKHKETQENSRRGYLYFFTTTRVPSFDFLPYFDRIRSRLEVVNLAFYGPTYGKYLKESLQKLNISPCMRICKQDALIDKKLFGIDCWMYRYYLMFRFNQKSMSSTCRDTLMIEFCRYFRNKFSS